MFESVALILLYLHTRYKILYRLSVYLNEAFTNL